MPFVPQSSSYTGATVVTEVRRTLGDLPGVLFGDSDALAWINAGQREIADQLDLFGEATVDLVAGQAAYVIPVEIQRRIRDLQVILVGGKRLRPVTYQQAQERWMDPAGAGLPAAGDPVWWFQRNQTVTLVPAPEIASTDGLTVQFARQAVPLAALTDALDIPDSHYNALVSYVQYRAYGLTQETELAAMARSEVDNGIRTLQQRERRSQTDSYVALEADEALY